MLFRIGVSVLEELLYLVGNKSDIEDLLLKALCREPLLPDIRQVMMEKEAWRAFAVVASC